MIAVFVLTGVVVVAAVLARPAAARPGPGPGLGATTAPRAVAATVTRFALIAVPLVVLAYGLAAVAWRLLA